MSKVAKILLGVDHHEGFTLSQRRAHSEAAVVAADMAKSTMPRRLSITGAVRRKADIHGPSLTDQLRRSHADPRRAIEDGACIIAATIVYRFLNLQVIEKSCIGTSFDYYLAPLGISEDDPNYLKTSHVLEVSGTADSKPGTMTSRVKAKVAQVAKRKHSVLAIVVVVDFSAFAAKVVRA